MVSQKLNLNNEDNVILDAVDSLVDGLLDDKPRGHVGHLLAGIASALNVSR